MSGVSPKARRRGRFDDLLPDLDCGLRIDLRRRLTAHSFISALAGIPHVLFPGDEVSLEIDSSKGGHLLLLDDGPEAIYCVSPSTVLPACKIPAQRKQLRLPAIEDGWLPVAGPKGNYRLLAFLTYKPLPNALMDRLKDTAPHPVGNEKVARLHDWLSTHHASVEGRGLRYLVG
jgi:hypothetical protein